MIYDEHDLELSFLEEDWSISYVLHEIPTLALHLQFSYLYLLEAFAR